MDEPQWVISDTGSTSLFLPPAVLDFIANSIDGIEITKNGVLLVPCDLQYSPVEFRIAGRQYSLGPVIA
jgi:hypothetical protein